MFKILIAEDDSELRRLFARVLLNQGYSVREASNGKEALEIMEHDYIDLVLSDIMMPEMDGYQLVKELRAMGSTVPVLMITAKTEFEDMQRGFSTGSDDYMVKPVNVHEMVLRVGALLRRAQMISERRQVIGGTELEFDSMTVRFEDTELILPQKEFQLLYKMVSFPGKIITRQQIMNDIWGYDSESDSHTVDVHINRLREKLKNNADIKIVTIRGVGYKVVKG